MTNPYQTPGSLTSESKLASESKLSRPAVAAILLNAVAILSFISMAWVFTSQAARLASEATQFPMPFRDANSEVIQSSWVLGVACVFFAGICAAGVLLALQNRIRYSWSMLVISIACFVTLTIVFRPSL